MNKKILVLIICLGMLQGMYADEVEESRGPLGWLLSLLEEAGTQISGYAESGNRSSLEDFEDGSSDADYTYLKYNLRISEKLSDTLAGNASWTIYDKDYETQDTLDNISKIFRGGFDVQLWERGDRSVKWDLDFLLGDKKFENSPSYEYTRTKVTSAFSYRVKDLYTAKLSLGIDTYGYKNAPAKDQQTPFGKIGGWRYFSDRTFKILGSYSFRSVRKEAINRERVQRDIRAGFDWKIGRPGIYKLMARAGYGNRDTRMDEEIDEDYDYEYGFAYVKSEHRISPTIKTTLKYQYFIKDYSAVGLDHKGYFIQNNWNFKIIDGKELKLWFEIDGEHKETDYDLQSENSYIKQLLEFKCSLKRPKDWRVSTGLQWIMYDYEGPIGDKVRYYAVLSGEKLLKEGNLRLNLDLKFRITDNESRDNDSTSSIRAGARYTF